MIGRAVKFRRRRKHPLRAAIGARLAQRRIQPRAAVAFARPKKHLPRPIPAQALRIRAQPGPSPPEIAAAGIAQTGDARERHRLDGVYTKLDRESVEPRLATAGIGNDVIDIALRIVVDAGKPADRRTGEPGSTGNDVFTDEFEGESRCDIRMRRGRNRHGERGNGNPHERHAAARVVSAGDRGTQA